MDAIAGLLDGPRARGAFLLRACLEPPWSLRIADEAPLTLVAVVRGEAWMVRDDAPDVLLEAGDVAIICGPDPYTVADEPGTEPQSIILPGQRCVTPEGLEVQPMADLGVRTWGNSLDGPTELVTACTRWRARARSASACCGRCRRCWCCAPRSGAARVRQSPRLRRLLFAS